jgi:DNA-binding GntR family transcriptional regulator
MAEEVGDASDHTSSSGRLVEEIRSRIVSGELSPGAKITERELAQRYGVNRAPLREALLRLEERRLIERVPFSGTRIFQPSNRMLSELWDMREVLEGLAARRAAETATDTQIQELRRMASEGSARLARTAADDYSDLPAIRDIHMRIAVISGNRELERILNSEVWLYLRANYRRWVKAIEKRKVGALQHERIAEAIGSRDGDIAEMLMRKHIRTSRAAWVESLNGSNGAA